MNCTVTLQGRVDDNVDTIKKRLDTFHKHSKPVIEAYKEKACIVSLLFNLWIFLCISIFGNLTPLVISIRKYVSLGFKIYFGLCNTKMHLILSDFESRNWAQNEDKLTF